MATLAANPADDAPHLLVVDDDRRIRALLLRFLLGEGYRVTTAETVAGGESQARKPQFRSSHPRRDDARREWVRFCPRHPRRIGGADPHAHGARREGEPHQGPRNRRRRLSGEAVRAAGAFAAHRQHSAPGAAAKRAAGGIGAVRSIRVPPGARRTAPWRGDDPPDRPRTRDVARACRNCRRDGAAPGACGQWRERQRAHGGCAGQPAAPQDRTRSGQPA